MYKLTGNDGKLFFRTGEQEQCVETPAANKPLSTDLEHFRG